MLPALNDPQVKSWFGAAGDQHKPPAGAVPQSPPEGAADHDLERAD